MIDHHDKAIGILDELRRLGVIPRGISADSRRIVPGDVFVAMPGMRSDGRAFIREAVAQGAAGILWESKGCEPALQVALNLPNLAVADLQAVTGELAHLIYGRPSEKLWICGITGTNGKTSVSQWIAQAFALLGRRCGVIGTLGSGFPGALQESVNTTPDAISVHSTLARMISAGAEACAMEVSSIGLDQGRIDAVELDVAVFTNLTRDHLEYHQSMEAYGSAKAKLFAMPGIKAAVINLDDAFGVQLGASLAGSGVRRIGYTLNSSSDAGSCVDEVLAARSLTISGAGLNIAVETAQGEVGISVPLLGRFNAANLLAVLGALLAAGVSLEKAAAVLPRLLPPPGRMQVVTSAPDIDRQSEPLIVVDYAHTPDALEQALSTLREVAAARGGKLVCIFGCGGERDPGKRPLMGKVVERLADECLVTSDNPRGEDPQTIIADILSGMSSSVAIEADRANAIRQAVLGAARQDVLLIAGKGHEPYQEIAGRRLPFSDIEQARSALAERGAAR